jgi:hypothetical protein
MQTMNGFDGGRVLQPDNSCADIAKHISIRKDTFVSIHY